MELTLAIHYVFNTSIDKIIWDVGHQAYTHKIITGRYNNFYTLYYQNGLLGFPQREESIYDVFNTGHSSTSISAGAGISKGKIIKNDKAKTISMIGDGSIASGMAFKGLNWIGNCKKNNLIIIINNNEMSISSNYFNKLKKK